MPEIQEEEIDLREYINVLLKRKGIIILIFLIAVLTTALVSYFTIPPPPIYQSSIIFGVARIVDQPIIGISESIEIMKGSVLLDEVISRMGLEISVAQLTSQLEVKNLKNTNFIEVSMVDNLQEKAKNLAEKITEIFIKQNQGKYQEKVKFIEDRLKTLETQITELEKNIWGNEKIKKEIATSKELSEREKQFQTSLLSSSSISIRNLYITLIDQENNLEASLKDCENFKIINNSQILISPIKPNKILNNLIAGVLGLFVGIFVAFFLEFWQKGK